MTPDLPRGRNEWQTRVSPLARRRHVRRAACDELLQQAAEITPDPDEGIGSSALLAWIAAQLRHADLTADADLADTVRGYVDALARLGIVP